MLFRDITQGETLSRFYLFRGVSVKNLFSTYFIKRSKKLTPAYEFFTWMDPSRSKQKRGKSNHYLPG